MFLPIHITEHGFIFTASGYSRAMLHRETRNIHLHHIVSPTLREAKERVRACSAFTCDKPAVLALTPQGEGDHIWCAAEDKDEVLRRVANYKSCYGYWTVRAWRKEG